MFFWGGNWALNMYLQYQLKMMSRVIGMLLQKCVCLMIKRSKVKAAFKEYISMSNAL